MVFGCFFGRVCVRQVSELKVSRQMIEKKAEEDRITAAKVTKQKKS
jgi:hypothetical protein